MRIVQDFTDNELKVVLNEFYSYFKTGFEFEEFLKPFLESIGLSEVVVTKKTGDGGIDLEAVKEGLSEINNVDSVKYRIQAKRHSPSRTISPEKIDALRGNLCFNEKGLFITTAKVSDKAKEQAISKDPSKPVFVIDGIDLIRICIDRQIGFAYKPIFSKSALDMFTNKNQALEINTNLSPELSYVEKTITTNDVRVYIISLPRIIIDKIENNNEKHPMKLIVNGDDFYDVTFCPSRNYLSQVTSIFRKYGLLQEDGTIVEKKAKWAIDTQQNIYLSILWGHYELYWF